MQPSRSILPLITILGLIGIFSVTCKQGAGRVSARGGGSSHVEVTESEQSLSAILFVNDLSCPCTRKQCCVAQKILQRLKEDFSNCAHFESIDYELQHEKAKPLMEKFGVIDVPVLVVFDGDRILWKCKDFSDENAVRARFEESIR